MKLERFKRRNPQKTGVIIFSITCLFLLTGIFLYSSFASFQTNDSIPFVNGNLEDFGDIYFVYYLNDELTQKMPAQGTGYTFGHYECTNGATIEWDYSKWSPIITNLSKTRTKCKLYFRPLKTVSTILGTLAVNEYTPDFSKTACDNENCDIHEKGLFELADDNGTSYYYRGSVTNNLFYFANLWWRVVRINGDGTIRLIYDGTTAHDLWDISEDRHYKKTSFNTSQTNNSMYTGYMYTDNEVSGVGTSSVIKQENDAFYAAKLASYAEYIDPNAGFCGDRSTLNLGANVGIEDTITYFKGYLRVASSSPSLKCENESDLYTTSSATKGNKALTYPVGLLTIDEAILSGFAGGVVDGTASTSKYNPGGYLVTGHAFWTMTPAGFYTPYGSFGRSAIIFGIHDGGIIDDYGATSEFGLRPVINLKNTVQVTGNGTIDDPYKLQ